MPYAHLLVDHAGPIATVTLHRPAVLNALNAELLHELDILFSILAGDPGTRVILLRGAGPRAFAAGADIHELASANASAGQQIALRAQRIFRCIETLGKPVLACIHGFALGGGCELALACTLRLGSDAARLGQPELKLGVIPGFGGTQRLPRLIGPSAALKMILTGQILDAAEALRLGLLDEVIPGDPETGLMPRARELAAQIAAMPPLAVAAAIEAVTRGAGLPLDDATVLEASLFARLCDTADKAEGTRAFLEKRPPTWQAR